MNLNRIGYLSINILLISMFETNALQSHLMPKFSWDTLPVAWHGSNPSGMYSPDSLQILSKFPTVTIEKWQGLDELFPDEEINWENCQNGTDVSKCGCCAEDMIVEVGKAIKEISPETMVIGYFHSFIGFPNYQANHLLDANPDWWAKNQDGSKTECGTDNGWDDNGAWGCWDHAQEQVSMTWEEACLNMTKTGYIDSCFFDHCGKGEGQSETWLINKKKSIVDVQTKVNGPVICGSNGDVLPGVAASQLQNWGKNEQWSKREIPMLMEAVSLGAMFQAHGACPENEHDQSTIDNIAAFLIAAGPYSYYMCGKWHGQDPAWFPIYDKPLGDPLGDAKLGDDGIWRRSFKSGTNVAFDTKKEKGTIDWSN